MGMKYAKVKSIANNRVSHSATSILCCMACCLRASKPRGSSCVLSSLSLILKVNNTIIGIYFML